MELHALILSLLLLTIVHDVEPRSVDTTLKCATTCAEPRKFDFSPGYTYQFNYAASVASSFHDGATTDQSSPINIRLEAMIDVLSPCEHVLRITRATIENSQDLLMDGIGWSNSMQNHPLHFSWQDGKIPQICASNQDPAWVLNVKRGVLSSLQVSSVESVNKIEEVDVTGNCQSSYEVESESGILNINKSKDYNTCENRDKYLLFSYFTPYSTESPRQNFIYSRQSCQQRIVRGMLQSTNCEEEHIFRPFSNAQSGARTTIAQTLEFIRRRSLSVQSTVSIADVRRASLIFEDENTDDVLANDISEFQALVSNLCQEMTGENYQQVGKDFIKMIFLLRRLDFAALEQAYSSLNGACPASQSALKGMFQDALQWCGSEQCVKYASRLIAAGPSALPDDIASRWLTGMGLITKPTPLMLEGMMAIVQSNRLKQQAHLTAGTMIHHLCSSSVNCMSDRTVTRALQHFEDKLGVNCRTTDEDRKQDILLALRFLGNAGRTTASTVLEKCAQESDNDMEIRIAAVQTFRRMPCDTNADRSGLKEIVFNYEEDSEIRIASYLSLMKCPTPTFIKQVVNLLDNEPVKQVASFISTHLNQLLTSSDPMKGYIKPLVLEAEFAKKYDLDPRKYSRFYEASFFSEKFNAGATVESNVVWSPKSFVPRSAELDLSVDIFGQAVNLLEIGGRVEGVEKLVQNAMNSNGFLRNNPLSKLFMPSDDDDNDDDDNDEEESIQRSSRSANNNQLVELERQYKRKVNTENNPAANWYLRVFGNELYYENFKSMKNKITAADKNSFFSKLLQGGNFHYHDDTLLMNSAHILPTGVGLPLSIAFNGTASVDVSASGSMDMSGLFKTPLSVSMDGTLNPRAVVLVTGSMSVDAGVTTTGIATESSAVTSWKVGGRATVRNGQSMEIRIDTPYQRNTLFSFNHKLMKINGDVTVDIGSQQASTNTDCSQEIAGKRVCMDSTPNAVVFPISGPISFSAYMEKTDNFDYYLLNGSYISQYSDDGKYLTQLDASLLLDTPGSRDDRRTTINANYNRNTMQMNFNFRQPGNNITLQGSLESELTRKTAKLIFIKNGDKSQFEGAVKRTQDGSKIQWEAEASLDIPSRKKTISGKLEASLDPSKNISASLNINNLLTHPIKINAGLEDKSSSSNNRLHYKGESQITIPGFINTGASFNMNIRPRTDAFDLDLTYKFIGQPHHQLHFLHKRRDHSTSDLTSWNGEQKLTFTQFPSFNHHVKLGYSNGPNNISSSARIEYGSHAGKKNNVKYVSLNQTFMYSSGARTELQGNFDLRMPPIDVEYNGNMHHIHDDAQINSTWNLGQYGVHLFVEDNTPLNGPVNKGFRLEVPTPWGKLQVSDTIEEIRKDVYYINGVFGIGTSRGLSMTGECTIENLKERKSISIDVVGDNNISFLSAESVFEFLKPRGFNISNSMSSKYNRQVILNLSHHVDARGERGFQSDFLFKHEPNIESHVKVDFGNTDVNAKRAMRIEFKDRSSVMRFIDISAIKGFEEQQNNEVTKYATISFSNNLPEKYISINSLFGQVECTSSASTISADSSLTIDDSEIVGFSVNHSNSIQKDNSALNSLYLNLRHGMSNNYLPHSVAITTTVLSSLKDGYNITANYVQDKEEKLSTSFYLNKEKSRVEKRFSQHFLDTIPENFVVVIEKVTNGVNTRTEYTQGYKKTITFNIVKDTSSSLTATLSHDDGKLAQYLPRSIESILQWGKRRSDNGKGIWLRSMIDDYEPLTAEIMYHKTSNHSIVMKLEHRVRLAKDVPRIDARVGLSGNLDSAETSLSINEESKLQGEFNWAFNRIHFNFQHSLPLLNPLPSKIAINANYTSKPKTALNFNVIVQDKTTSFAVSVGSDALDVSYFSNCSCLKGEFKLSINKLSDQSENPGQVEIIFTRGRIINRASVSFVLNRDEGTINAHLDQNLYENIEMPLIPTEIRVNGLLRPNHVKFIGRYNEYELSYDMEYHQDDSTNKYIIDGMLDQNILKELPDISWNIELENQGYSLISVQNRYQINNGPQRTVSAELRMTGDTAQGSKTLRIEWFTDESKITGKYRVPNNAFASVSVQPLKYGFNGKIETNLDDEVRNVFLSVKCDIPNKLLRFEINQDVAELTDLGVFRNVTTQMYASPSFTDDELSLKIDGFVQINDQKYTVEANGSMQSQSDEINVVASFEHNILPLYNLGVPLEVRTDTSIGYSVALSDFSGGGSLQSVIRRTMLDEESGEKDELNNNIRLSVVIDLLKHMVEISASHDLDIPIVPRNIKYEVSYGASDTNSPIVYKLLKMALTLDGKKQCSSIALNLNKLQQTFTLAFTHNATKLYKYGIPGKMQVIVDGHSLSDFEIEIVSDTLKKSVGYTIHYHNQEGRTFLKLQFNHNFDLIVEELGIPKTIGLDVNFPYSNGDIAYELTTVWGTIIHHGHMELKWEEDLSHIRYHLLQNFTKAKHFPRKLTLTSRYDKDEGSLNAKIASGKKYARFYYEPVPKTKNMQYQTNVRITQNFDKDWPSVTELTVKAPDLTTLDLLLKLDRVIKLDSSLAYTLNLEEMSASLTWQNSQMFVEANTFPEDIKFYANASLDIPEKKMASFVDLKTNNRPTFKFDLKSGLDEENNSIYVELSHGQKEWKKYIAKKTKVTAAYTGNTENENAITLRIQQGKKQKEIFIGSSYTLSKDSIYGRLSCVHDFDEFAKYVPLHGELNLLLEKSSESANAEVNVTSDRFNFAHSIEVLYSLQKESFDVSFQISQHNDYFDSLNIPHTIAASISSQWDGGIGVTIDTTYGDKIAQLSLLCSSSEATTLQLRQTWYPLHQQIRLEATVIPKESATLTVYMDGIQKEIHLSGNVLENEGAIRFTHNFDEIPVPKDIVVQGSYEISADLENILLSVNATIDGKVHSLKAQFNKRADGFHISTNLLDDITRTATFRKYFTPGAFSVELEHDIPELEDYIPTAFGLAASVQTTPRPNITLSIRKLSEIQTLTTEVDMKSLKFAINHDFDFLPIPRSIIFSMKGSTSPLTGSATLSVTNTDYSISGTLDTEELVVTLNHSIPAIPLPNFVRLSLNGSIAPLSGSVSITIDGIERNLAATLDSTSMQGTMNHNVPELDRLFIARDIIIGVKGNAEELSGEIYISIDGLERRIAGSANRVNNIFNFFQNVPEIPQYFPKNVTLSIAGSIEPLKGSAVLTMDDVERHIETEVKPRSGFALLNHRIPEFDSFLPRHLSVSTAFTKSSSQINIEFTKNKLKQSAKAGLNFEKNHVRVQLSNNIKAMSDFPSEMSLELSGSLEYKNVTLSVAADDLFVNVNGEMLVGENNWYGASFSAQHNIKKLKKQYSVPRTMQAALKVHQNEGAYEIDLIFDVLKKQDYTCVIHITPRISDNLIGIEASYAHTYNNKILNLEGSIIGSKEGNEYTLRINGEEQKPNDKEFSLSTSVSTERINNKHQITARFESSHNIKYLFANGFPYRLPDGQATVTVSPDEMRIHGEASMTVYSDTNAYAFDLNVTPSKSDFALHGNVRIENPAINQSYSARMSTHFALDGKPIEVSGSIMIYDVKNSKTERDNNMVLTITPNQVNYRVHLRMKQNELNDLGFPVESDILFHRSESNMDRNWQLHTTFDEDQLLLKLTLGKSLKRAIVSFDQSLPYLPEKIPRHLQANFSLSEDSSEQRHMLISLEYNNYEITMSSFTPSQINPSGSAGYQIQHNIPFLNKSLGFYKREESYSYSTTDDKYVLEGSIINDNVERISTRRIVYDMETGKFTYSSKSNDDGLDAALYYTFTNDHSFKLSFNAASNEATLLSILFERSNTGITALAENHLFNKNIKVSFNTTKNTEGCEIKFSSRFDTYATTFTIINNEISGKTANFKHDMNGNSLSGNISVRFNASPLSGEITASVLNEGMIGHFPKRSQFSASGNSKNVRLVLSYGSKEARFTAEYTEDSQSNSVGAEFLHNFVSLQSNVPREIIFSMTNSSAAVSVDVSIDNIDVLKLLLKPSRFSLNVKNLTGKVMLLAKSQYKVKAEKSFKAAIKSTPLNIDLRAKGAMKMFEQASGNSTITLEIKDNENNEAFNVIVFGHPTSTEASDAIISIKATSTIQLLPFNNVLLRYNCTSDSSMKFCELVAVYNDKLLSIDGEYESNGFKVGLKQPWYKAVPKITVSGSTTSKSSDYDSTELKIQWGKNDDSLTISNNYAFSENAYNMSFKIVQPSGLTPLQNFANKINIDFSKSHNFNFGVNIDVNGVDYGFNATYEGVFPQVIGQHRLVVDVKQPFKFFPGSFQTSGNMTLSSGTYDSNWRITSGREELVLLTKKCMISKTAMSSSFLWKQSYFQNVPLKYISMESSFEKSESEMSGLSKIQIDNMPISSFDFKAITVTKQQTKNNSLTFDIQTGALSKLFILRTMSFDSWISCGSDERQKSPKYSVTVEIDGKRYHVEGKTSKVSSRKASRFETELTFSHPLDLVIFGYKLPKHQVTSLNTLERKKGSRIVFNLNNDLLDPFKVTTNYRFDNGNILFEHDTLISYGRKSDSKDITIRMNLAKNENGLDYELTTNIESTTGINCEVTLGGLNNDDNFGFKVVAKDYSKVETSTWEVRFSFKKLLSTMILYFDSPEIEPTTLRGDLSHILNQGKVFLQQLAANASETQLSFVKGIKKTVDGYDMHIGYEVVGDSTYSLHLVVGATREEAFVSLQTKTNYRLVTEVSRMSVVLADPRLIKVSLTADKAIVNFFQTAISKFDAEFSRKVNCLADHVIEFLNTFKTIVTGSQNVERITYARIDGLIARVNHARNFLLHYSSNLAATNRNRFNNAGSSLEDIVRDAIELALNYVENARDLIHMPFDELKNHYLDTIIQRINSTVMPKLQPIMISLRKVNAGELFIELVEEAVRNTIEFLMTNSKAAVFAARRPISDFLIVTESEVIFNIPLKFEVDGFTSLPSLNDLKKWLAQSALSIKIDDTVNMVYSYADKYYQVRSLVYIPRDELLPPFKGHTLVSRFRHFGTFDKRYYDFSSGCATSHILAADMRDGNFSVVLSYGDPSDSNSLDAIEVTVGPKHVTVYSDYKVEVGRKIKQLPLDLDILSVVLEGSVIHIRRTEGDMDVACDFSKELCTVDVSPFYFGATAGLAGVYNNEPADDFKAPSHEVLNSTDRFASSWEVANTACSYRDSYKQCSSSSKSTECTNLFESLDSPLRPCFPVVDPEPFLKMCQNDMCESTDSKDICAAAHAYRHQCNLLGARTSLPNECVVCKDATGTSFDASRSLSAPVSGLDFVLVVEQGSCMANHGGLHKAMRKFFKSLSSSLSSARMRNNRFHLVGYGGPGATAMPHTFTMRNMPFTYRKNNFIKTIRKMALTTEQTHADAFGAISYASQIPFRAGAKPIIVLLSCDECSSQSEVSYSTVEQQLRDLGIMFLHLPQRSIKAGHKYKHVYGFDSNHAYTKAAMVNYSAIKPSKTDMCVQLATLTGGSVWDATRMGQSSFVGKITQYIVDQAGPKSRLSCKCEVNSADVATSVCA